MFQRGEDQNQGHALINLGNDIATRKEGFKHTDWYLLEIFIDLIATLMTQRF
jgi:hypothetical protein